MKQAKSKDPELEFLVEAELAADRLCQMSYELWGEIADELYRYRQCQDQKAAKAKRAA